MDYSGFMPIHFLKLHPLSKKYYRALLGTFKTGEK
jgi:hypothetical protein